MNKLTWEALLINGKQITATKNLIGSSTDDTIDPEFVFGIPEYMGNFSVVVFEKLFEFGTEVEMTSHEDINDENQTINVMEDIKPLEEFEYETPENSESIENPNNTRTANESMKSTWIPMIIVILVLLANLGLLTRKK